MNTQTIQKIIALIQKLKENKNVNTTDIMILVVMGAAAYYNVDLTPEESAVLVKTVTSLFHNPLTWATGLAALKVIGPIFMKKAPNTSTEALKDDDKI